MICFLCKGRRCKTNSFNLIDKPGRRADICNLCLANSTSPLFSKMLKEGTVSASKVLTARVGSLCPGDCVRASTGVCSVATRATQLAALVDELDDDTGSS